MDDNSNGETLRQTLPSGDSEAQLSINQLGLALHRSERAICLGKKAIRELVMQDPVDEDSVEIQRQRISEARLSRNILRSQLDSAKAQNVALPRHRWILG